MNLTPHSLRSPISPYDQQSKQSFSTQPPCYPTTPQSELTSIDGPDRGLGIFNLPLSQQQQQQRSSIQELPPSPQPSDTWSHSPSMEQDFPQTSQPPDIFSAAFDPFSGYANSGNHNNNGVIASTSPEAPGLVFCQTPSHRSSISSSQSPFMQTAGYYDGKVKQEDSNDWYPAPVNGQLIHRSSLATPSLAPCSNGVSPINSSTEDYYKTQAGDWSKPTSGYPTEFDDSARSKFDAAPVLPSVNRIKKKRQRTTPEEATHECRVCGKLFKRSYNWKSHMETHNPERKYPHPCTAMVGNAPCTKKFQRKTDLDRHVDSVHLKAKNHRCNLCGNRFARRDTLRRHTEDGCPKRFELGFREGSAVAPARWSLTNLPRHRSYSLNGMSQSASSSMAPPMSAAPSSMFPTYARPEFVSSPIQTASVFTS